VTDIYRGGATIDHPAYDWDVIWFFGMPKIHFRNAAGDWRTSSDILDDEGRTLTDGSVFADAKDGTRIPVLSGKTYVLTGPRQPYPDHPQLSMLYVPEPEPRSWMARLFRR
jgi:hypothetical protein